MPELTEEMKKEIREIVYDFYAEKCEVDRASLNDDTNPTTRLTRSACNI